MIVDVYFMLDALYKKRLHVLPWSPSLCNGLDCKTAQHLLESELSCTYGRACTGKVAEPESICVMIRPLMQL